jgi:CRISPR type III-A-associated RAMP protein Csm4
MAPFEKDIVKLSFTGPLHIGSGKGEYLEHSADRLHSDTIKAAIYSVAISLDPAIQRTPEDFIHSFNTSSAFPYYGNTLFFPKPFTRLPLKVGEIEGEARLSKKLKKINFLAQPIFENMLSNKEVMVERDWFDSTGKFLFHEPVPGDLVVYNKAMQSRVSISKDPSEPPSPYDVERIYFSPDAGLFFLVETRDKEVRVLIDRCLGILGSNGFGTDRSVGNGQFTHTWGHCTIDEPSAATHLMNLSLLCPEKSSLEGGILEESSYLLTRRGGYIASAGEPGFRHFRKRSAYMFLEGSVFPVKTSMSGKVLDLRPGGVKDLHPVWRDGRSIFIHIKAPGNVTT